MSADQAKLERLLKIIKLMTSNVRYSVDDIAQRLNTSPRTIYRYVNTFKDAGFVVDESRKSIPRLLKESPFFKDISELIHFSEEEAHIINQLIESLDPTNMLKQNLRRKLTSIYDCTSVVRCVVKEQNATNVTAIVDSIKEKRQIILHDYASAHSNSIRDRLVEAIEFTTNYEQIWCYDIENRANKLFKTSRIGNVEQLETPWQYEAEHNICRPDIFRMISYDSPKHVQLRLSLRARNLLIEEYPLSEKELTELNDGYWLLNTMVNDYKGIGRFTMGLLNDIEIIDSPEFEEYIRNEVKEYMKKMNI